MLSRCSCGEENLPRRGVGGGGGGPRRGWGGGGVWGRGRGPEAGVGRRRGGWDGPSVLGSPDIRENKVTYKVGLAFPPCWNQCPHGKGVRARLQRHKNT